jgi:hypothetical protein
VISYELAKELKDAGFPQGGPGYWVDEQHGTYTCPYCGKDTPHYHRSSKEGAVDRACYLCRSEIGKDSENVDHFLCPFHGGNPKWQHEGSDAIFFPTLSELIEACGVPFHLKCDGGFWFADRNKHFKAESKSSAVEAVARLWLALNRTVSAKS